MSEELLPYYNRELAFIRSLGAEFAEKYPKIASRLRLSAEGSKDPHVERLVEAFAYLNARIRHKLDDDFPEISDALLSVLYPHYQRPVPSMSIVQFVLDRTQAELVAGYRIARGTLVETEPVHGDTCRYQTSYDATLYPCDIQSAALLGRPFAAPPTARSTQAKSVLRISLGSYQGEVHFSKFLFDRLRLFLHPAQGQNIYGLYELILNHTLEIALARSPHDQEVQVLPKSALATVGFESSEAMLPYSARMFNGYRLLSEFFAFPEKFLFIDLMGLTPRRLARMENRLEIYFYLDRSIPDLERTISRDTFRLGCAPIVNLFPHRADPFVLTQTQTEYRVVPDARRPTSLEIYSIDRVRATSNQAVQMEYHPFYSFKHGNEEWENATFWHATRRPGPQASLGEEWREGTEMHLAFVDLAFSPKTNAEWRVEVETTCTNRGLPQLLPFGGGRPELDLPSGRGPISAIRCLLAPTSTLRPDLKHRALWKVISHLSLNHLSLADATEGADALREILRLYDLTNSPATQNLVTGIESVQTHRVVGRASGIPGAFCRGLEVRLVLNEEKFHGSGAYLFANVLDRFLGLYVSINSFSKLVVTSKQRATQQEPWKWPARSGEQVLL